MESKKNSKIRFNILIAIVYIIGIVLLVTLFNLQIINGEEYRQISNTRLTREKTITAARGNLLDSSGNKLVSTTMQYNVELYKTKIDNETLNNTLLLIAQTLEENGDKYTDNFPITVEPYAFKDIDISSWKKSNEIDESYDAEACFNYYKEKYKISTDNVQDARKIIALRYLIAKNGYSNTRSVQIASNISNASYAKFNEMGSSFPGVSTYVKPIVSYPYVELASHILGYVGPISKSELENNTEYNQNDIIGKTGIEKVFEKYLKGKDGTKQIDMSVDGVVTDEYISEEAVSGSDVVLTIDADLQKSTEDALAKGIASIQSKRKSKEKEAKEGAAVVINVKTGEILAMASYPNYNPSLFTDGISQANWDSYLNDDRHPLVNKAIADQSAPGSTFKLVTAIAGLESGVIDLNSRVYCTGKYTYYKDYQPYCWNKSGHGALNVVQAIEHSCNFFFYDVGRRAGIDKITEVARAFGLGQKTGLELPDEITGTLSSPNSMPSGDVWTGGKTVQTAIGQLYNDFTPIQMAKYTAMLANGGKNIELTIVKSINNPDGTQVSRNEIESYVNEALGVSGNSGSDLSLSSDTIAAIRQGMKGVTSDDGGTAYSYFKDFNIEVGGKTGSASNDNSGNANAWFIGFAPFNDPEIAVAVYVKNGQHGGYTAPIAREIFAQYLGMNASQITEDTTATSDMQQIR